MFLWTFDFEGKKVRGFFWGPFKYQKKLQIFKNYWKNNIQESCTKNTICTRRRNHTFFYSPFICIHYEYNIYIYNVEISVCMFDWLFITHKPLDWDEYPGERCVMKLVRTFIRRKEGKKRIGSGKNEEWWVVRKRRILCPNSFKSKEVNSGTNTTHFSVSKY